MAFFGFGALQIRFEANRVITVGGHVINGRQISVDELCFASTQRNEISIGQWPALDHLANVIYFLAIVINVK